MPVMSADGHAWSSLAVLSVKKSKFKKRQDRTIETPFTFLQSTAHCPYREKAGVDTDFCSAWAQNVVEETTLFRKRYRRILLAIDGYGAHCS